MWRFSWEEAVYFSFLFWMFMAIKGRAPPRRGRGDKGLLCGSRYGAVGWETALGPGTIPGIALQTSQAPTWGFGVVFFFGFMGFLPTLSGWKLVPVQIPNWPPNWYGGDLTDTAPIWGVRGRSNLIPIKPWLGTSLDKIINNTPRPPHAALAQISLDRRLPRINRFGFLFFLVFYLFFCVCVAVAHPAPAPFLSETCSGRALC